MIVIVKVRHHEDRGEMDYIFGKPVLKGWHKIRKVEEVEL